VGDGCPDIRPANQLNLTILVVVLIGSFHYSTHEFSAYHGGEIPLQAAAPWFGLAAYHIPETGALPAALLATVAVCWRSSGNSQDLLT
jgi:hypothetical protein